MNKKIRFLFLSGCLLLLWQMDLRLVGALSRSFDSGVHKIAIDPGYGGQDPGPAGCCGQIYAKEINLQMAKTLKKLIREQLDIDVVLTRETDEFRVLEERTAIANASGADLFISIHSNAALNESAYGIETYYLNLTTDSEAIRIAAEENATSPKNIHDMQAILSDLMENAKNKESRRLANMVQTSLCRHLASKYTHINNRGIKQAPFYVLLAAQMPAVMVQVSFLSNQRECGRLKSEDYQKDVCEGIIKGIQHYIEETSP